MLPGQLPMPPSVSLNQFKWSLSSRELFKDWKDQLNSRGLTDIQRAARYYYLQRLAYGGRVRNRSYGTQADGPPRINLMRLGEDMTDIWMRLSGVHIENLSWKDLITRYDGPDVFFYCDPPYYQCPDYKHNFVLEDFISMADQLAGINGKFMLSIKDHPDIREVFKAFNRKEVSLLYTVSPKGPVEAQELIYSNFELKRRAEMTLF